MKCITVVILFMLCLGILSGCNSKEDIFPLEHKEFIEKFDWSIKSFNSEKKYGVGSLKVLYQQQVKYLREEVNLDLGPFNNKEVIETEYVLDGKINDYNLIYCHLFESNGKIIGSYLALNKSILKEDNTYQIVPGPTLHMIKKGELLSQK